MSRQAAHNTQYARRTTQHGPRIRPHRWLLLIVLLLALALRLYRLGSQSLWYDETVSVYLASQSIPALIAHTAGDIHPPGYYLLLHLWTRLAGSSDWAVAFPSLFLGMLLVALAYRLAARLFGVRAGLLAAGLVAISPFNLWYSQEVRMYTLGAALGMGLLSAVIDITSHRSATWRGLAAYALCGALGLWTLYYFAFLLVAMNLMIGVWWALKRQQIGWPWLGRWALAQGAVLLLYMPWLPVAWRQATSPPVPPWRSFTGLGDLLGQTWSALSLGQSAGPTTVWPVLLLFAGLFGLGLLVRPVRSGWLLAGHLFLPVLLIYLASFVTPLFHVRYVFTYSTPFYVILGAGLVWLGQRWRPALWLALAVIVAFSSLSVYYYHFDSRYASDDHRAAVRFLAERWRPGDVILVDAGYTYTALVTYWHGDPIAWRGRLVGGNGIPSGGNGIPSGGNGIPPYELADEGPVVVQTGAVDGDPGLGWGDPQSDFYAMSRAETEAALERLFAGAYRVWVYRIYDTVTDPDGYIRDWLDGHSTKFEDQVFTGESQLRVQGYLGKRQFPADIWRTLEQGLGLDLGGAALRFLGLTSPASRAGIGLAAARLGPPPPFSVVEVGGVVDLDLYWQRLGPLPEELILYVGLEGGATGPWAQTDERPLGSLLRVDAWPEGEVIRTPLRLRIPAGTPPGYYSLVAGWYSFVDGQPIWLPRDDGAPMPLQLATVSVRNPQDWSALPLPEVSHPAGVTLGSVEFLGFDVPRLEARPGETLRLNLFWQARRDGPERAGAVLQLIGDDGRVWAEVVGPPATPFTILNAGQVVRDPRLFALPADLKPGVYTLSLGRRQPDGAWLPVRRGPFNLGPTYPLATVHVR